MSAPRSPSGEAQAPAASRGLFLVIGLATAVRLIVAANLHLTEDEAYYRLWSMAPALGYYDHPPMIAWWVWLGRTLAGDTPLGVRLAPILAAAMTAFLVVDIARQIGASEPDARRAGAWYNGMILVAAGGILAVPDAPATLFWALTLSCLLRAVRGGSLKWWAAMGVAAGLATLSKYSALFLAPGVILWLVSAPARRRLLATPGPWIAAALALALFGLNLGWNAEHHWVTISKQFGRIGEGQFSPLHLATFVGAQCLLLNPLMAVLIGRGLASRKSRPSLAPPRSREYQLSHPLTHP